ncbi:transformer-2 sex-determining protein isoform X1 [Drosophila virilis]|uniref:Transformer-2 sex-determining protein n=3 Tax=Drosophila virilis TaxID=7244 RepID=TRA2_DROVI|nr:transformer-2 sex-determining protein isoform X1 [Drosophila virilis]O02008.1 RecName: Full=Transformer-2 sex-determining protein [Drosophila virilis]AAB58113.1 transformer-2 protein isoform 272 [Drosophila virilis]EDW60892.2 tra2, isoform D [Drosophila virilis]
MSTGLVNAREKEYLHLHRIDKHKCSHSSATSSPSSAASSESSRTRQRRSDGEVYGSRHNNYKSSSQHRRRSRSGSDSPQVRHYSGRTSRDRQRMRQARDHPQASRCIGVFGLNTNTTQQKVRELFNKFGPIERIQMVIDAHTHRSRGFCFIYFENLGDARVAKDACTGMEVDGRRIRVDYSITQRAHTPTPGVYMGRPSRPLGRRSRERDYSTRDTSRSRRRHRDESSSVSPYDSNRRKYRSRHRYDRSRSRTRSYSRSRSPRKPVRVQSRY